MEGSGWGSNQRHWGKDLADGDGPPTIPLIGLVPGSIPMSHQVPPIFSKPE